MPELMRQRIPDGGGDEGKSLLADVPGMTRAAGALPAPLTASSTLANTSPRLTTSHRTSRRSTAG
jgi:hypothetical protein